VQDINIAELLPEGSLEQSQVSSILCSNILVALHLIKGWKSKTKKLRFIKIEFEYVKVRNQNAEMASLHQASFPSLQDPHD
jgi:hypothetical protein